MTVSLLSAAIWLNYSSWAGMPVSTTHSIVGAVAGFGIVAAGYDAVNWGKMGQIVASWFISPVAGGAMAFLLFKFISRAILGQHRPVRAARKYVPYIVFLVFFVVTLATIYKGLKHVIGGLEWMSGWMSFVIAFVISTGAAMLSRRFIDHYLEGKEDLEMSQQLDEVERVFTPLVIISSCSVAFAHGANDVANAVGPLAAIVNIAQTGSVAMKVGVPFWVLALGGTGIVLGLATYGYRVMATVGTKITEITPSRGVAADIAATTVVLICTRMKLPISTTHTLVGAILGIGLARGLGGIDRTITKKIFGSWFVTVPAAAILSMILFFLGRAYLFDTVRDFIAK